MVATDQSIKYIQHNSVVSLLKEIRIKKGFTQKDVAAKLHKPQSYVSKYESGARQLSIIEIRQICNVMGMQLITFVELLELVLEKGNASEA